MNDREKNNGENFDIPDYPRGYNCEPIDSSPSQALALISFYSSLAGLLCCSRLLAIVFSIVAIITGAISLHKYDTRGFAISGIIMGIIGMLISIVALAVKFLGLLTAIDTGINFLR